MNDNNSLWNSVLESIKVSVSGGTFSTWFSQTHLVSLEDAGKRYLVEVGCPTSYTKNYLEQRYFGLIQDTLTDSLGKPCDVLFIVKENPGQKEKAPALSPLFEENNLEKRRNEELSVLLRETRIKPSYSFENFAVSSSNQMAYAAAQAVSESPGTAYNPLFIWGGVGVGKSHLASAVGHVVLGKNPDAKIYYCTAEDFTNDIVDGIRNKTTSEVRKKYRKLEMLLIDDIQFIAGKDTAQEEFFHTFNAVTSAGGQIILTSDKPPSEISKLEERLISRFEAGLIVDIAPPDFELRCAIVQIKSKQRGMEIPMNIVQVIAGNLNSARQIEGFLTKLLTQPSLKEGGYTPETIQSLLGKNIKEEDSTLKAKPDEVVSAVSKYYSIGKRSLLGDSRARVFARPRQVLMYLLRRDLGLPLEEVGRQVGDRDHTTVMHAVEKITQLASTSVQIREDLLGIKKII